MTSTYFDWRKLFGSVAKRIESVDAAKCPRCGARQLNVQYVASPRDRIGYGTMWCENCWHGIWISRTNVPEGWSYATFEEAERGIIPNFIRIEPRSKPLGSGHVLDDSASQLAFRAEVASAPTADDEVVIDESGLPWRGNNAMTPVFPGTTMWLSSSEHPSWGRPRRVVFQRLLHGPADRREYALLTIDPDDAAGAHDEPCAAGLVVTARFDRSFDRPEPGHPVHVHVWLFTDGRRVQEDRFEPMTTNADAWCTLYASPEEAQEKRATPW